MMLSPLVQAGALQNSQSPVDTEGRGDGGDGASTEPSRSRRWSILLIFEELMYWSSQIKLEAANSAALLSEQCNAEELGQLEAANAALLF